MSKIDPALLTLLVSSGLLAALVQIAVAVATYLRAKADSLKADLARQALSQKIDDNTVLTKQTQAATDGMKDHLVALASAAAFTAGKKDQVDRQNEIQAGIDAKTTPLAKPPEKP
jgi:hypothetical protein